MELIGGKEPDLALAVENINVDEKENQLVITPSLKRNKELKSRLTEEDQINHKEFIETLKVNPVWYN